MSPLFFFVDITEVLMEVNNMLIKSSPIFKWGKTIDSMAVEEQDDYLSCDRCGKVKTDDNIHLTHGKTELVKYAHKRFIPYTTNLETDDNVWLKIYKFEKINFADDKTYTITSELWMHEDYTGKDLCQECATEFINLLANFFKEES